MIPRQNIVACTRARGFEELDSDRVVEIFGPLRLRSARDVLQDLTRRSAGSSRTVSVRNVR